MRALPRLLPLSLALLVSACATPPKPAATPHLPPPAAVPPPPAVADWRDLRPAKGAWHYETSPGTSVARFATPDGVPLFAMRCDKATRRIVLSRADAPNATGFNVTTSYGHQTLATPFLAANDTLLDQIAFSRGHFTIEASGVLPLVLPAWAEPGRVIEDCRS